MFSVYGCLDGKTTIPIEVDCSQLLTFFPTIQLEGDLIPSNSDPSEVDSSNYIKLAPILKTIMDQTGKKKYEKSYVVMPEFLVNNPNISIIPATNTNTSPKQHPIPVSRISRNTTGSTLINNQDPITNKCIDSNENKNGTKRASSQTSDSGSKKPRMSNTKIIKVTREKLVDSKLSEQISKLNAIEINQIKRFDTSSKLCNINAATSSSTSSSINKIQDSSFQPSQTNNTNTNCKVDSENVDSEKVVNGTITKYQFSSDGQLKINQVNTEEMKDLSPTKGQVLEIRTRNTPNDEYFSIERTELISQILTIVKSAVKSHVPEENYDNFIQCTKVTQSPEHNRLTETKTISPNVKLSPVANHNNIITPTHNSNSKLQPTTKVDASIKSTRISNQPQKSSPKPVASIQISPSSKQASTSSNLSPKAIKQSDIKHQVISNQHSTPLKHPMATVTQIQSSSKQINKNPQLITGSPKIVSVTHVPSVNRKVVTLSQFCDKPVITCQSSLQNVKKCSKCNALSEEDVCTTCLMSSQLKGVTVTRIETPGTELTDIIDLDSDKDDDVEETNFNSVVEPNIIRVETKDQLKKHIDKLSLNPNLLEDKLWHKDLSSKDFFKFDQCHNIQIGSFITSPVPSGDLIICIHGIRMTVNNTNFKAITIDIPTEYIIKIYGNYAEMPTLIIYTNYLTAVGIQYLLNNNEKDKSCFYDPLNKDHEFKKIMLSFDIRRQDVSHLEKLLMKLNGKYEALTSTEIRSISFKKSVNKEKEDKKLQVELPNKSEELDLDTVIVRDTLEDRKVAIRVRDFKMLAIDEYLNDILIEFYLNRWYMRMLTPENKNLTYVFNTYFYTTLTRKTPTDLPTTESKSKMRHDRVKKWTKNVNIFEKDYIFIPINESFHWYMIVVCFPNLTGPVYMDDGTPVKTPVDDISYFENRCFTSPGPDAMKSDCDEADGYIENLRHIDPYYYERVGVSYEIDVENLRKSNIRPIKQPCILVFDSLYGNTGHVCRAKNVATIREWLAEEYRAKHHGVERDFSVNVVKGHTVKVPQQTNFTDCGLFVLHFFEKFFQRPIVDYSLPILHLENWFLPDEVQKNCQKRKDVANLIQKIFQEQSLLPPGTVLPTLRFVLPPPAPREPQPSQQQSENFYIRPAEPLENLVCDDESNEEYDLEPEEQEQEPEQEEIDEEDEYDEHVDESVNYNSHNQCDDFSEEEEDEYNDGSLYDYYPEMDDESPEDRNNIRSNVGYVHPESYEIEHFDNMNPNHDNVVNVEDSLNGSLSQRNHQHMSNANYRLYRSNNLIRSHNNDEDDYNGEGYDEDEEPSRSTSYSNRHNRHFKRRRLSNE